MTDCECHFEVTDSHETCCGHEDGRNPDCPTHGDGSGPRSRRQRRTLSEALDAAQDAAQFKKVIQGLFRSLEAAIDAENDEEGKP